MSKKYFTYRICVNNEQRVQIEKYDTECQSLGRPQGNFCYPQKREEIEQLLVIAHNNQLDRQQPRQIGEALFDSLFDPVLRQDFINFYVKAVQQETQLLRIELDIDEEEIPEIAALPWEFLCLPEDANQGTVWLATDPNLVFSRRRALWNPAQPIQLATGEKLRIALAISAPKDLPSVEYAEIQEYLEALANEQSEDIELLSIVNPATPTAINELLEQKPHIFHFIGHGRFENEAGEKVGQIALVRKVLNKASWVDAQFFAGLFVHIPRPGIVILQACEGGMQSESEAFRGVAAKIVGQNIPVVLAMQYEVANAIASVFSSEFYRRLGKGEPVDIAAQKGRYTIGLETQYKNRDFATPVIFMNVQDGYLFTTKETSSDDKNICNLIQLKKVLDKAKFCGPLTLVKEDFDKANLVSQLDDGNYVYYLSHHLGGQHLYVTSQLKSEDFERSYHSIILAYYGAFLGRETIFDILKRLPELPELIKTQDTKKNDKNSPNTSDNPRLKSLQKQKQQLESQIAELEKLSNRCSQDIKAESNAARRSQLNTQIDNYSIEIDELYEKLKQIEDKINKLS
ncbi:CHAT domain-containing protein [Anabaena cylindrica FACHB-243]|uniref:CHAT domain-containing protein n=1 Tax=Anabaena cylindrica (strain ATCC 27899 / PCC 7122) TaxID=272123 RepID=K9ZPX4_ANACC|nr:MULTISPECIES: CHAT domain-containing protein [Anabaena]AFZ61268.1 hypothetical protein Anacy_5985 [Anabaena cylindrica PCC 7122]MBD2418235.1 CHAT domain-containing protein [Anabaena cylindrica FACHB-243]MBY5285220.1 CHAT domain-containing protein [Anabaena sp. CCAP 1446/1C]MBY5311217.1 CHAT domain-containing protein [Anabaena sp. CCAP 1446/1C]MCM2409304.1 CHAT domain-containing protein [Anabaena sp. CCAP 1446/1C]